MTTQPVRNPSREKALKKLVLLDPSDFFDRLPIEVLAQYVTAMAAKCVASGEHLPAQEGGLIK